MQALEAIDRILNRGGDADDILRQVVATLSRRAGYAWAGIFFLEDGELALGPQAGTADHGTPPHQRPRHMAGRPDRGARGR